MWLRRWSTAHASSDLVAKADCPRGAPSRLKVAQSSPRGAMSSWFLEIVSSLTQRPASIIPTAAFADQPTRLRRAKFSRRSAAAATLSAGLVIRAAISRARVTYCGARMVRRSATSDSRVVVEKRRAVPTFSRLTAAPQSG